MNILILKLKKLKKIFYLKDDNKKYSIKTLKVNHERLNQYAILLIKLHI